jgi:hypothetical protein
MTPPSRRLVKPPQKHPDGAWPKHQDTRPQQHSEGSPEAQQGSFFKAVRRFVTKYFPR